MSSLMNQNWQETVVYLNTTLPITLASRVLASSFAAGSTTCVDYWKAAGARNAKAEQYCDGVDITNPNGVYHFLNASWYSWSENDAKNLIGCTTTQLENFYDTSDADSFGSAILAATTQISTWYGCVSATNCTAQELTALQWGSYGVTNNPNPAWGQLYTP